MQHSFVPMRPTCVKNGRRHILTQAKPHTITDLYAVDGAKYKGEMLKSNANCLFAYLAGCGDAARSRGLLILFSVPWGRDVF
jgi:hypothetical protein